MNVSMSCWINDAYINMPLSHMISFIDADLKVKITVWRYFANRLYYIVDFHSLIPGTFYRPLACHVVDLRIRRQNFSAWKSRYEGFDQMAFTINGRTLYNYIADEYIRRGLCDRLGLHDVNIEWY